MTPTLWFSLAFLLALGALICALRANRLSRHQDKLRARRDGFTDEDLFA